MGRLAAVLVVVVACGDNATGEDRQGGATTIDDRTATAFTHPAPNLAPGEIDTFTAGASKFGFIWQIPELGPLFNNNACLNCHAGNGRGASVISNAILPGSQGLVRVSMPVGAPAVPGGDIPVPGYGLQLHDHASVGLPQVMTSLSYTEQPGTYGDGTPYSLRVPSIALATFDGSTLPDGMLTSYRTPPQIIGLGLLEAVPPDTVAALADPDDLDGDGIRGHVNLVWNVITQATVVGRFGVKANTPTLLIQAAAAFVNDIGLTSYVFPDPSGNNKLNDDGLNATGFFVSTVAVPVAGPRSDAAWRGRTLFDTFACSKCHVTTLVTGDHPIAAVAHQTIHPYTDLLVHDMGDGLADGRPDFTASGSEFRTPALWGVGLAQTVNPMATFLHDGRARTLDEAILWHGGEATGAREAFRTASARDRDALLAFLASL